MERDSSEALHLITKDTSEFHHHLALLADVKDMLEREGQVQLRHILREGNSCADGLACMGATQNESWKVWRDPPPALSLALCADACGV